jgi:hypothetical protein
MKEIKYNKQVLSKRQEHKPLIVVVNFSKNYTIHSDQIVITCIKKCKLLAYKFFSNVSKILFETFFQNKAER